MFASIEQVFELETMMRFKDSVLKQILEKIGTPALLTDGRASPEGHKCGISNTR